MADTLASLDVFFRAKDFDVLTTIDKIGRGLEATRKATVVTGAAFSSAGSLAASFGRTMNQVGDFVQSAGRKIQDAGHAAVSMGQALTNSVTSKLVDVGQRALTMSGQMEGARIGFTTMLGSAEKADAFIRKLWDFAAKTPFEFAGLRQASQRLLAFGFEAQSIIPMLTAIGDAAGGLNAGQEGIDRMIRAFGQMKAAGTVMKEDLNQLTEVGIPAAIILQEKLGLTQMQVANIGKEQIDSQRVIGALIEGMVERTGGLMEKQAASLPGLWATAKDNISMFLLAIGDDISKTFDLKVKLAGAIEWIQQATQWFQNLDAATKTNIVAAGAFVAALGPALTILGQIAIAAGGLVTVLGFLVTPMGLVTAGLAAFAAAAVKTTLEHDALKNNLTAHWPAIRESFEMAWLGMQSVFSAVNAAMKGDWDKFGKDMETAATLMGQAITRAVEAAMNSLGPIINAQIDQILGDVAARLRQIPFLGAVARGSSGSWLDWAAELSNLGTAGGQLDELFRLFGFGGAHASGAIVKGPQLALIGEGSYSTPWGKGAEAVVPLHGNPHANLRSIIGMAGGGMAGASSDPWSIMAQIAREQQRSQQDLLQQIADQNRILFALTGMLPHGAQLPTQALLEPLFRALAQLNPSGAFVSPAEYQAGRQAQLRGMTSQIGDLGMRIAGNPGASELLSEMGVTIQTLSTNLDALAASLDPIEVARIDELLRSSGNAAEALDGIYDIAPDVAEKLQDMAAGFDDTVNVADKLNEAIFQAQSNLAAFHPEIPQEAVQGAVQELLDSMAPDAAMREGFAEDFDAMLGQALGDFSNPALEAAEALTGLEATFEGMNAEMAAAYGDLDENIGQVSHGMERLRDIGKATYESNDFMLAQVFHTEERFRDMAEAAKQLSKSFWVTDGSLEELFPELAGVTEAYRKMQRDIGFVVGPVLDLAQIHQIFDQQEQALLYFAQLNAQLEGRNYIVDAIDAASAGMRAMAEGSVPLTEQYGMLGALMQQQQAAVQMSTAATVQNAAAQSFAANTIVRGAHSALSQFDRMMLMAQGLGSMSMLDRALLGTGAVPADIANGSNWGADLPTGWGGNEASGDWGGDMADWNHAPGADWSYSGNAAALANPWGGRSGGNMAGLASAVASAVASAISGMGIYVDREQIGTVVQGAMNSSPHRGWRGR